MKLCIRVVPPCLLAVSLVLAACTQSDNSMQPTQGAGASGGSSTKSVIDIGHGQMTQLDQSKTARLQACLWPYRTSTEGDKQYAAATGQTTYSYNHAGCIADLYTARDGSLTMVLPKQNTHAACVELVKSCQAMP
jgi:hypothetical protein